MVCLRPSVRDNTLRAEGGGPGREDKNHRIDASFRAIIAEKRDLLASPFDKERVGDFFRGVSARSDTAVLLKVIIMQL